MLKDLLLGGAAALFRSEKILNSPLNVQIEPTTYCNQSCKMCIRSSGKIELRHMEENLLHLTVKKLSPQRIVFAGKGEPLLNPVLPDMVSFCVKSRIRTMVSTNLTAEPATVAKLLDSGVHVIKVSIDAPDPDTYAAVRGETDGFQRVVDNIRAMHQKKSGKAEISFEYLIMKENFEKIPDMIDLAGALGIKRVFFRELQTEGLDEARRKELVDHFDLSRLKMVLSRAEAKARKAGIRTNLRKLLSGFNEIVDIYSRAVPSGRGAACLLPWVQIFVAVNGDLSPCGALYANSGITSGNIAENSRDDILNGTAMVCIRRGFKNGKIAPVCRDCIPRDFSRLIALARFTPGYVFH
jgi:MoaA/NifB/PqqE/SkfB family radical SAM enzyme